MPFDAVRCANCGGEIQLDDAKESGVCIYCGMKVIYKDAVIKLQVSGNLSIADADGLEKSLQRAATFHELGYLQKEEEILLEVVNQYPRDHRAWAILSQNIFATFQMRNAIASGKKSPTEISNDEYAALTKITANRNLIVYLNNALKLVGDEHLARLYAAAARRFHLADWDLSILRKLRTVDDLSQKLADEASARRMEVLEWIIIILIAASMVIPFLPGLGGKLL